MQEPADLDVLMVLDALRAQQRGQQHQMIIMNPHEVRLARDAVDDVGEALVDALVSEPVGLLALRSAVLGLRYRLDDVVKEWPELIIAEPIVVCGRLLCWQEDGHAPAGKESVPHLLELDRRDVVGYRAPAHPDHPHVSYAHESRDHAPASH